MTTNSDLLDQAIDDANTTRAASAPPAQSTPDPTPSITGLLAEEPDIVDRIFSFLAEIQPEMFGPGADLSKAKRAVREEFGGSNGYQSYIRKGEKSPQSRSRELASVVLQHFNGRNASEVARRLHISRATVYRCIKQPGR